jgi:hypothetical protein
MKHFNNNQPCVVLSRFNQYEIVEFVALPLTVGLLIDKEIPLCHIHIRPDVKGTLSTKEWEILQKYGIDSITAANAFDHWYQKLGLKTHKRIYPITYDWARHYSYIERWLGFDQENQPIALDYFSMLCRDLSSIMLYWDDIAVMNNEVAPFPKTYLLGLGKRLGVSLPFSKTLLDYAFFVQKVYEKLISVHLEMVDLPLVYPNAIEYEDVHEEDQYDFDVL